MQLQRNLRSLRRTYSKCFFLQELLLTGFVSVAADPSPHTVVLLTAHSPQPTAHRHMVFREAKSFPMVHILGNIIRVLWRIN